LSVLQYTDSDYPFDILKLFLANYGYPCKAFGLLAHYMSNPMGDLWEAGNAYPLRTHGFISVNWHLDGRYCHLE
jgi:hypothetical protein